MSVSGLNADVHTTSYVPKHTTIFAREYTFLSIEIGLHTLHNQNVMGLIRFILDLWNTSGSAHSKKVTPSLYIDLSGILAHKLPYVERRSYQLS